MSRIKTPDEWDAEDHIKNLKRFRDGEQRTGPDLCRAHTDVLIWIVRRLDLGPRNGFELALAMFRVSPVALLAAALLIIALKLDMGG
jgi:hypothetical protein